MQLWYSLPGQTRLSLSATVDSTPGWVVCGSITLIPCDATLESVPVPCVATFISPGVDAGQNLKGGVCSPSSF